MKTPGPDGTVLLYSGGVDSETVRRVYDPDVCLYIDAGTRYSAQELDRLGDPDWLTVVRLDLGQFERDDAIIPTRNLIFVTIGSMWGNRLWLAATAGDRVLDKDYQFANLCSAVLTHIWQPQWWTEGTDRVRVELPVKDLTKKQLLQRYRDGGGSLADLWAATFSCYNPDPEECWQCKPCRRKWVAFRAAGLDVPPPPGVVDSLLQEVVPQIQAGTYGRGAEEERDIIRILRQEGAL